MKQAISILAAIFMFSMVSYGGQWQSDDRGYWYQNDDGSYVTGWLQDADGRWYYLDDQTGYMLSGTVTPDGYILLPDGSWSESAAQQKAVYDGVEYDRMAELMITSYSVGPSDVEVLEYPLPVTVYYNNTYTNVYGGTVKIHAVQLSGQGSPYISYHVDTDGGAYDLKAECRYNLKNDRHTDSVEDIFGYCKSGELDASHHLLWREMPNISRKNTNLLSAVICIKEGSLELR